MKQKLRAIAITIALGLTVCTDSLAQDRQADERRLPEQNSCEERLEQPFRFIQRYFISPDPECLNRVLRKIDQDPGFEEEKTRFAISHFLAGAIESSPETADILHAEYERLSTPGEVTVIAGLVFSDTEEAKKILKRVANDPTHRYSKMVSQRLRMERDDILETPIESDRHIDALWARFSGSGDTKYVDAVIDYLKPEDERTGWAIAVQGAAQWSLTSMGKQYESVRQRCKHKAENAKGPKRDLLRSILEEMSQAKQPEESKQQSR